VVVKEEGEGARRKPKRQACGQHKGRKRGHSPKKGVGPKDKEGEGFTGKGNHQCWKERGRWETKGKQPTAGGA